MSRLASKTALVTGSTSGMGETTARAFVREGAQVVITGRNSDRGGQIAASLGPDHALFVEADVTNEADIERLVEATLSRFGKIDCLFNNAAGPTLDSPVDALSGEGLAQDMMSIFGSVVLMTKHVARVMKAASAGSIINNGSSAAHRANSSPAVYSGLKAGVCHLTRCYAMELSEFGIRVNTISPGAISTPIFAKGLGVPPEKQEQATELISDAMGRLLPVGRIGTGEDIAYAAIYLASDESSFVTGQDLLVDGGLTGGLPPSQKKMQWQHMQQAVKSFIS